MKATGIIRKIDELGRVVLPIELRRALELEERDPVAITLEGDCIILRKYHAGCIFCGAAEELLTYRSKNVCRACLQGLNEEDE